jgi:hypothetical protein
MTSRYNRRKNSVCSYPTACHPETKKCHPEALEGRPPLSLSGFCFYIKELVLSFFAFSAFSAPFAVQALKVFAFAVQALKVFAFAVKALDKLFLAGPTLAFGQL